METFEKLPRDKRNMIVNAAFSCLGKNGYKKTSMREIAVEANVSKAALFHYFGTKKGLYLYLFRFSSEEIIGNMQCGTEDFFESIEIGTRMKMDTMKKYPGMFDFLVSFALEEDPELSSAIRKINPEGIQSGVALLFEKVDWTRFLPHISVDEARNLVQWVSDGYIRTYTGSRDGEQMVADIKRYLDILKKAVYKEEYLCVQ